MPNFLQVRVMRELDPFFIQLPDDADDSFGHTTHELVGKVVNEYGEEIKPLERIPRERIQGVSRAILTELSPGQHVLVPVKPVR